MMTCRGVVRLLLALSICCCLFRPAIAECQLEQPDLGVAGMRLLDPNSARSVVGAQARLYDGEEDLPHARFVNNDGAQELSLFAQFDADIDQYSEAEVKEATSSALVLDGVAVAEFVTERGVRLGMTTDEVVSLIGACVKAREASGVFEIVQYEILSREMSPKMRAFGFQVYFAEYEFQNGQLIRFRFGFENP